MQWNDELQSTPQRAADPVSPRRSPHPLAAYLLPALNLCLLEEHAALTTGTRRRSDAILVIIVAPSQELAIQIVREARPRAAPHALPPRLAGAVLSRTHEMPAACASSLAKQRARCSAASSTDPSRAGRCARPPLPVERRGGREGAPLGVGQAERVLGDGAKHFAQQCIGGANIHRQARQPAQRASLGSRAPAAGLRLRRNAASSRLSLVACV